MTRRWIFVLMIAVVAVVVAIFVVDARHDRKLVFDGFIEERLASTKELAAELGGRFASVRKDVLFFRYLVENSALAEATAAAFHSEAGARFQRELRALLAVVPHYKEMHLVGPDGGVALRAREENWKPGRDADAVERALAADALRASGLSDGRVRISAPIRRNDSPPDAPGYRIFSASVRFARERRGALLLLVEPDYLFGAIRAFRAPDRPQFALLNAKNGRVSFAAPGFSRLLGAELGSGEPRNVLAAQLFSEEPGLLELDAQTARRLGFSSSVVVTHAPLPALALWRWSLVAFNTAEHLVERDHAVILRSAVAMGAVLAGLGVLGMLLLRQVRREAELRENLRLASEISHLHELSQKILDNVPAGLLALGDDLRVRQANRVMLALSPGATPGAALAQAFPYAGPAELGRIEQLLRAAQEARDTEGLLVEHVRLWSEEPGAYNLSAVPLVTPSHSVALLLVVEDLSELKRLERELVRAEKLSTMGILAAGIAHEIGTPLGVVRARAEILLGKLGGDPAAMRSLQAIVAQSDAISRIISRVLEFTRTRKVEVTALPLGPAVREAAELLREKFEHAKVKLQLQLPDAMPVLLADADGFRQVLLNLLRNACDACKAGGRVTVRVAMDEGAAAPTALVEVQDDGCGIPAENLHSIFDPFFTTKKGGEGTGLGLAIAQDVVKNHGGTLSVESAPGQGSTFALRWRAAATAKEQNA